MRVRGLLSKKFRVQGQGDLFSTSRLMAMVTMCVIGVTDLLDKSPGPSEYTYLFMNRLTQIHQGLAELHASTTPEGPFPRIPMKV